MWISLEHFDHLEVFKNLCWVLPMQVILLTGNTQLFFFFFLKQNGDKLRLSNSVAHGLQSCVFLLVLDEK